MPILVKVGTNALTDKDNRQIGQVAGIYPDNKKFTERELATWEFETITVEQAKKYHDTLASTVSRAYKAKTTEWTTEIPEVKHIWKDAEGNWNEISEKPFKPLKYEKGEFVEVFSDYPKNTKTVIIPTKEIKEAVK